MPFVSFTQYSWQWAITDGGFFNEAITAFNFDNEGNIYVTGLFQEPFSAIYNPK